MPASAKPPDLADMHQDGELPPHPEDYPSEPMPDPDEAKREAERERRGRELDRCRVGRFADEAFELFQRRRVGTDRPVPMPPDWTRTATELHGGLWPGCYILVGATGAGKSQWAFELAYHAVTRTPDPVPVVYVGLELDAAGVVARLAALGMHGRTGGRVPWAGLYLGKPEALAALDGGAGRAARAALAGAPFYLVTGEARGGWAYSALPGLVAGLRARHPSGPALVIVDFLQLVGSPPEKVREDLRERIGNAAYGARMAARDAGVSVLLLSATARNSYALFAGEGKADGGSVQPLGTGDPGRLLGTGKESGEVEYAADGVLALCRGSWTGVTPPPVWLAVAKSRTGRPTGCSGWTCYGFDGTTFAEQAPPPTPTPAKGGAKSGPANREPDRDA
jgi:hypothetical protein